MGAITNSYPATVQCLVGTWTHAQADANETITIAGTVWAANFSEDTLTGSVEFRQAWSQSVSGTITTLTIYSEATVTAGKFIIWYTPN